MAQKLRVVTALEEYPGSVSSIHIAHTHLEWRSHAPLLLSTGSCMHVVHITYIHLGTQHILTENNKSMLTNSFSSPLCSGHACVPMPMYSASNGSPRSHPASLHFLPKSLLSPRQPGFVLAWVFTCFLLLFGALFSNVFLFCLFKNKVHTF